MKLKYSSSGCKSENNRFESVGISQFFWAHSETQLSNLSEFFVEIGNKTIKS